MINFVLGQSKLLTVTFQAFDDSTDVGSPVDPISVVGNIKDGNGNVISGFHPQNTEVGTYAYVFTPNAIGRYIVEFVGTYADGDQDVIAEEFDVTAGATIVNFSTRLGDDTVIQFMPMPDDVYIDPEEIMFVFPDASPIEVISLIQTYSQEVEEIFGPRAWNREPLPLVDNPNRESDITNWPTVNFDYIKAATLCALSKMYGFGDADLTQITLGDLEVTNQRFGRTMINRANAVTWCEIAGALRAELVADAGRNNMKAVRKGSRYSNPIPRRQIRQFEHGR